MTTSIADETTLSTSKYATLMETSGEDHESWYYFLKWNGNEENLKFIEQQLTLIDEHVVLDDIHLFDIDINNLVSATTAKELTLLELNSRTYHRKFDGVLQRINFKFKSSDRDEEKLWKVFDKLGDGDIKDFITDEDVPEGSFEYTNTDSDSSDSSSGDDESENDLNTNKNILNDKIPSSLQAKYLEQRKTK